MRDGELCPLPIPELTICGNESGLLPTPTHDSATERKGRYAQGGTPLTAVYRMWPTPNVPNGGRQPKNGMSQTGMTPDGKKRQVGLENAVRMWPTATAADSRGSRNRTSGRKPGSNHHDGVTLCDAIRLYPTPTAQDAKNNGGGRRWIETRNR
jgi:hypothetical protein